MVDEFQPCGRTTLPEVDSPETHASDEDVDAIAQRLVLERTDGVGHGFRAVGMVPAMLHFRVRFLDGHLQGRVGHGKRYELLPVLGARQSPGGEQPFVKRGGG